jgi:hypothetical protein
MARCRVCKAVFPYRKERVEVCPNEKNHRKIRKTKFPKRRSTVYRVLEIKIDKAIEERIGKRKKKSYASSLKGR